MRIFFILFFFSFFSLQAQDVPTIAQKMDEKMYNVMNEGVESLSCKVSIHVERVSLVFAMKIKKEKEPEVELLEIRPAEFKKFASLIARRLKEDVANAIVGTHSKVLRDPENQVELTFEEGEMKLNIRPKDSSKRSAQLWLKEYVVVKSKQMETLQDPMNAAAFIEVETESEYTWKKEEKNRLVVETLKHSNDRYGERVFRIEYQKVEEFLLPKSMKTESTAGNLEFKYYDYKIEKSNGK